MFQTNQILCQPESEKAEISSKDYVRTTDEQKLQLIDLVINQKYSMKLASEIVGVKLSTVKYIIKGYKTDKQYFMMKLKPKKIKIQKEKKKPSTKIQNHTFERPISQKQSEDLPKPIPQYSIQNNIEIVNPFNSFCFENYWSFQNFFQTFTHWNNIPFYNNDWIWNYQEN